MATKGRKSKESRGERVIEPCKKIFFVERKLYRVILSNKSQNIVYLFSINEGKEQAMLLSDFRKNRKRAYTIIDTARLLNRAEAQMHRYIDQGIAPPPIGAAIGGVRTFHKKSYYSEDDVFAIREAMSQIHRGRPRNDGKKVNNFVLTEQELRAKMGDALMLYTKTEDGRFVHTWAETTY